MKTLITANLPPRQNDGYKVFAIIQANKSFSGSEASIVHELLNDEFMDRFMKDTTNLDEIKILIDADPSVVLSRASEVSEKIGMVFDGEAGQFMLQSNYNISNPRIILKAIIGADTAKIVWDKHQVLRQQMQSVS
jgi:hypothetical protein